MDCNEIDQPKLLENYFRVGGETDKSRVLNCFFKLYFKYFKSVAYIHCRDKFYTKHREEELAWEAFNEGLLSFYYFIRENGFANRGASVRTLLFSFCRFKLMGLITNIGRQSSKFVAGDPDMIIERENKNISEDDHFLEEYIKRNDKESAILQEAFQLLGKRCSDLLRWRKIDKMGDEEIAGMLNINPGSVNNEVYKCFKRLKKIVDELKEEK